MTLLKRTFTGFLWNSAGKTLEYVILYAISIIVARGLGLYQNGAYATLMSLAQILLVLSSMGLETTLNKAIPQLVGSRAEARFRFLFFRAIGVRMLVFLFTGTLLYFGIKVFSGGTYSGLESYFLLLAVYGGIRGVTTLFSIALTALFRTDIVFIVGVTMRFIELGAIVVLSSIGLSISALLILFSVTGAIQILLSLLLLRKSFFGQFAPEPLRPLLAFGLILWINVIVDFFLGRHGDIFFLTALTSETSQASLYDVAFSLAQLASLAFTVGFLGISFAAFAKLAIGPPEAMDRFYAFLLRFISFLTVPLYSFLVFNAEPVVRLLYSPTFGEAVILVQGMALFKIASRLFGGGENTEYLLVRGRVGWVSLAGIGAATVNIAFDILLIPFLGASGAVIGSGCANLFVNAATRQMVKQYSPVPIQIAAWVKLTITSLPISYFVASLSLATDFPALVLRVALYAVGVTLTMALAKPLTAVDTALLSEMSPRIGQWINR
jgi:O-antigen/teichoic acid export membrane protein